MNEQQAGTAPAGLLNIYKPREYTSFDCVAILRRALGIKKIGHTGTLDPMAEGVLVVCVGKATRIIEYLEQDTKEYEGVLRLGQVTDTDDVWGETLAENPVDLSDEQIENAFDNYRGAIEQMPPAYAAIKVEGKKLYQYAREGKDVTVKPRPVVIHELEILRREGNDVTFRMVCSKGTYVRAFCRDVGADLGCGGTMAALKRTSNGVFTAEKGISIEDVKRMDSEAILARLVSVEEALSGLPALQGTEKAGIALGYGQFIGTEELIQNQDSNTENPVSNRVENPADGQGFLEHLQQLPKEDLRNIRFRFYAPEFIGIAKPDRDEENRLIIKADKILSK